MSYKSTLRKRKTYRAEVVASSVDTAKRGEETGGDGGRGWASGGRTRSRCSSARNALRVV